MSRKASSNNVSLFPFLAVLVCAMGALILLLLVTTRRIRSNQLAALESQAAPEVPDAAPEPVLPEPTTPPPPAKPPEPPVVEPPKAVRVPALTITPIARTIKTLPPIATDIARIEDHTTRDREALRGYDRMLDERLNQWADADQKLHAQYTQAADEYRKLVDTDKRLNEKNAAAKLAADEADRLARQLDEELAALRRALQQKDGEPVNVVSKFRIVPFDGISGTIRHPIMIECVNDRFRFIPENVELTRTQLESFLSTFNPLLSGASALNTHWTIKDKQTSTPAEPYILLVVRPSGSLGYYAARRMLRRLDVPIGYELLGEEQELDLPIADPEAARVCRLAVNKTLARRDEIESVRPMARSLLAARQRALGGTEPGQPASTASNGQTQPSGRTDSSMTDERVESFRRLIAGMRTQNAPRPPSLGQYPDYTSRSRIPQDPRRMTAAAPGTNTRPRGTPTAQGTPRRQNGSPSQPATSQGLTQQHQQQWGQQPQHSSQTQAARTPGTWLQSQVPTQTITQSNQKPTAGELAQFPGFRTDHNNTGPSRSTQNHAGQARTRQSWPAQQQQQQANELPGGRAGAANAASQPPPRLLAPQPATLSDKFAGTGIPGTMPDGTHGPAGAQANGQLPTSITDGSTKPRNGTAPRTSQGRQTPAHGAQPSPAGTANLNNPQQPPITRFRRAVTLLVESNSVVVAKNQRINVSQENVSGPWLGAILTQIEAEVRGWGNAPMGTTWAPEVRFRISPNANQTHARVRSALKRLGMRTTDEFTGSSSFPVSRPGTIHPTNVPRSVHQSAGGNR